MKLTNIVLFVFGAILLVAGVGALASVALRLLWPAMLLGVGIALIGKAMKNPTS